MSAKYLENLFGLSGQTAVVIGGAGVLGGALCRGILQAGAHVIVADLIEDPCETRVQELLNLGGKAGYCTIHVTSRESVERALASAVEQTGRCR